MVFYMHQFFYKTLEIQKDVELKLNKGNFDARIILSNESKQCINWWIENIHDSYKPIVFKPPDRKIESDSSMLGYGALDVTNNLTLSDVWSLSERNKHINFLELKAAFLALKAFCDRTHIRNLELDTYSVKIRYGDLLKHTRPGYQLPEIFIEAFKPDFRICVVHTLHEYLERTNKLRFNNTQLFLSFQKPYKPVKKGTIAMWIKQVLILAGIDMTVFTPHSTRGAATSYVNGRIPIATILRTAGWRK
ncbi:unnamed protein product [Mytilus coruscus]|uniref:Uncharacterized protein n=1 Tax=Mytilus coruscus TaxID=42192 RepID=A0A6J8B149_MYTCO|nr:unnamed protein product [Mytilus coruscus]